VYLLNTEIIPSINPLHDCLLTSIYDTITNPTISVCTISVCTTPYQFSASKTMFFFYSGENLNNY